MSVCIRESNTLCWKCARSCAKCAWSRDLKPIDGWIAKATKIKISPNGNEVDSFEVFACPEFISEPDHYRIVADDMDKDGVRNLMDALMSLARDDYIRGNEPTRNMIEKFVLGKGAGRLHQINDPDEVIRRLRKAARLRDGEITRKIGAMHCLYGKAENGRCYSCQHFIKFKGKDVMRYKCALYDPSRNRETDWSGRWEACGMLNHDPEPDNFVPVVERTGREEDDS